MDCNVLSLARTHKQVAQTLAFQRVCGLWRLDPLTRPAPAEKSAGAGHPLPQGGEGQKHLGSQLTATASISTSISGSTNRETSTKLVAGWILPKDSACALATSSQSSILVT